MFAKLYAISALAAVAVAAPGGGYPQEGSSGSVNQCNVGTAQCCQQTQTLDPSNPLTATLSGLIGIALQGLNLNVGLSCSPISIIGGGNGGCNAKPVCCSNTANGGLISVGCLPIDI
ncbi:fungal hydrophobin [Marasmius fiardii PR-910]|nr:fungal hydrophobin [Marasmius fiardii PR-910]